MKERLDAVLAEKGIFKSRERAKAAIMAGAVYVDGERVDKPGTQVSREADFFVKEDIPYVSRGGLKLEKAIREFHLNLNGASAMDIGASTGGFTDCMLQNGASGVHAVDVGYGQLDWKLRNDGRVVVMEKTNIRFLDTSGLGEKFDFISIDVSFISLRQVFPVAAKLLKRDGSLVCLAKPQFEVGRGKVGKNGIVRDKKLHFETISDVIGYGEASGLYPHEVTHSPVKGAKGNIEYLILFRRVVKEAGEINAGVINSAVERSHSELSPSPEDINSTEEKQNEIIKKNTGSSVFTDTSLSRLRE